MPSISYKRIGGYDAIAAVVDNFVPRMVKDPRLGKYFVHSQDIEKFMKLRAELFPKLFRGKFPPNTICVIDRLVKEDFLLEVEAVATGKAGAS